MRSSYGEGGYKPGSNPGPARFDPATGSAGPGTLGFPVAALPEFPAIVPGLLLRCNDKDRVNGSSLLLGGGTVISLKKVPHAAKG
jgi:hypothetical protein